MLMPNSASNMAYMGPCEAAKRSALKPLKRSPGNHNSSKMVGTPPKARVRRTSITGSPVRKAKARATSALARKRLQAKMVRWAGP